MARSPAFSGFFDAKHPRDVSSQSDAEEYPAAVFFARQAFKHAAASAVVAVSRLAPLFITSTMTHLGTLVRAVPPMSTLRVVIRAFVVDVILSVCVGKVVITDVFMKEQVRGRRDYSYFYEGAIVTFDPPLCHSTLTVVGSH